MEQYWRTGKKPQGYEEPPSDEPDMDDMQGGEPMPADDPSVSYMGPDQGPFQCANCMYFIGDGQPCQKVSDPVESEGCCNQFQSAQGDDEGADMQSAPSGVPSSGNLAGL